MAAGAYDQRLYVIPSRGLTVVRNGPTGTNDFDDVQFSAGCWRVGNNEKSADPDRHARGHMGR